MHRLRARRRFWLVLGLISLLAVGCAPGGPSRSTGASPAGSAAGPTGASAPTTVAAPKRLSVITFREMDFLPNNSFPGSPDVRHLVNPGLAVLDPNGALQPVLAESIPTLENGRWRLLPDGRMETTFVIRPGASWHDGTPFTAEDLLFTAQVGQDRSTGAFGHAAYSNIDRLEATDGRMVTVYWKQPYIDADQMFTVAFAYPLPRHLLEPNYQQDPASLSQLPFWTQSFVGTGPFRLREYLPGTRITLEAFDRFALGRPKVDEVDLVYTPDPNTALANLFAGTADLNVGIGLPIDSAVEMRDRWQEGKFSFEYSDRRWFVIDPQFIDPNPAIIQDVRFRRALLHAIDRQEMAESLMFGLSPVAHTFMAPHQPDYAHFESRVMKYDFDPRRSVQMIEELGYTRGADGLFREPAGRVLEVEIRGSSDAVQKPMLSVADYWQRVGVSSTNFVIPPQRSSDWPWRAVFPGFTMFTGTHDVDGVPALLGNRARTAENNFEVSGIPNWPRYRSAEMDNLVNRYLRAIPKPERIETLLQINQVIAEQLNLMGLYYFPTPYALNNRVQNVTVNRGSKSSVAWNAHQWEVR